MVNRNVLRILSLDATDLNLNLIHCAVCECGGGVKKYINKFLVFCFNYCANFIDVQCFIVSFFLIMVILLYLWQSKGHTNNSRILGKYIKIIYFLSGFILVSLW